MRHVLYAENIKYRNRHLGDILGKGFAVFEAYSHEAVLRIIEQGSFDLIIIDPELPHEGSINGIDDYNRMMIELLDRIWNLPKRPRIIIITACVGLEKDFKERSDVVLIKPYHVRDLPNAVNGLFG